MKNLIIATTIALLSFNCNVYAQKKYNSTNKTGNKSLNTVIASNNYVTKKIPITEYINKLDVSGSFDVMYTQKIGEPSVEIYTSDNIIDLLDIKVVNNKLYIKFKDNTSVSYEKLKINVSSLTLNEVHNSGSGNISINNILNTDYLLLSMAGSGNINIDNLSCNHVKQSISGSGKINTNSITCKDINFSVTGSGDITVNNINTNKVNASITGSGTMVLNGSAKEAIYAISGSGTLSAQKCEVNKVSTDITGSGTIKCYAIDFLKIKTTGSGSVGYKGDPQLDISDKGVYKL